MAAVNVYDIYAIPSSSPPRLSHTTSTTMSSSPSLPSPNELLSRRPSVLRTGSKAPMEDGIETRTELATRTKAKRSAQAVKETPTLLEAGRLAKVSKIGSVVEGTKTKKASKPRGKKIDAGGAEGESAGQQKVPPRLRRKGGVAGDLSVKATRKPRTKKADKEIGGESTALEKTTKSRAKRAATGTSQSKFPAGRVTKSTSLKTRKTTDEKTKKSESISKHFRATDNTFDSFVHDGLLLQEAVKRRRSWTPPTATTKVLPVTTPVSADVLENNQDSGGSINSEAKPKTFGDLLSNFGFTVSGSTGAEKRLPDSTGTRKRKLIELVTTNSYSLIATPAVKEKGLKKRPKTITDQATSAYAVEDDDTELDPPAPLLRYFSHNTEAAAPKVGVETSLKHRSKSPVKRTSKPKKGTALAPILLSPESALKQGDKQDFIFGTSSQLAREESPTFLRELHQALQASNEVEQDDSFAYDPFEDVLRESAVTFRKCGVQSDSTDRSLWSAAQRDIEGRLLEIEMVDLVDSPAVGRHDPQVEDEIIFALPQPGNDDIWHDLDSAGPSPLAQSKAPELNTTDSNVAQLKSVAIAGRNASHSEQDKSCPLAEGESRFNTNAQIRSRQSDPNTLRQMGPIETAIRLELRSPSGSAQPTKSMPSSRSPSKASRGAVSTGPKSASTTMEIPNFTEYTDAQLAKEVASYHFKPVRKRSAAIALLEKCWEGKQRLALGVLGTNAMVGVSTKRAASSSSSQTITDEKSILPKKPRGRPRKDSVTLVSPKPKRTVGVLPRSSQAVDDSGTLLSAPISLAKTPKKSRKKDNQQVDEISDSGSDIPLTPSPPRRTALQVQSPPLALRLSVSTNVEDSPAPSPSSLQARLYTHISRAIKSAPPSKDPLVPSWHEKILLYDPIILEDLTVWLNTGALEKAGWDGEVAPAEVKKFCESKSICCLWKENLRGGTRSRY